MFDTFIHIAGEAQQNEERKDKLAQNVGLSRKSLDIFEDHLREIVSTIER